LALRKKKEEIPLEERETIKSDCIHREEVVALKGTARGSRLQRWGKKSRSKGSRIEKRKRNAIIKNRTLTRCERERLGGCDRERGSIIRSASERGLKRNSRYAMRAGRRRKAQRRGRCRPRYRARKKRSKKERPEKRSFEFGNEASRERRRRISCKVEGMEGKGIPAGGFLAGAGCLAGSKSAGRTLGEP